MEQFSVSFTLGKASALHGANLAHNNRTFTAANVDETRITENVTFRKQDIRDAYRQLFERALQEYNEKQTRLDRIITDYYLHMAESKRDEAFYEIVVQFGQGATLDSLRADMAEKEEAVRQIERTLNSCNDSHPEMKDQLKAALSSV